ncbi:MAG TPA: TonB-dependent receptor [Balneolaceae bacterium]|nr:TonB-dependent receptor [Balneolaceae bacterium]
MKNSLRSHIRYESAWMRYILRTGLALIFLLITGIAYSQNTQVAGTITDASSGQPLPGANIVVKGTTTGTTSDRQGHFTLQVPSLQDTVVVSFIGYNNKVVPINGRTSINVNLKPQTVSGGELVVTGYTTQRQRNISGSVSSVDVGQVNKVSSANVLQKLKGQVSGVTIESNGSPGSVSTVRIRGVNSFQNNDPLYIIDGVQVQSNTLNALSPDDIESVQVLKDAAAASIYGARASNGVVIITTKQGRPGQLQVTLDSRVGVATPVNGYNNILMQKSLNYFKVEKAFYKNAGLPIPQNIFGDPNNPSVPDFIWPNDGNTQTYMDDQGVIHYGSDQTTLNAYSFPNNLIMRGSAGTDWWDQLFDPALQQSHNLNISGGGDKYTYDVSFNYLDNEGTMRYNNFERGTVRANTQFETGVFTFGENASFAIDKTIGGMPNGTMGEDTPIGNLIKMQPVIPVHDVGTWWASGKANTLGNGSNPVAESWKNRDDATNHNTFFGSVFSSAELFDQHLKLKTQFSFDVNRTNGHNINLPTFENSEPNSVTSFNEYFNKSNSWTFTNTAEYTQTFLGNHNVHALAGVESHRNVFRQIGGSIAGFVSTIPGTDSQYISSQLADPNTKDVGSFGRRSTLFSYFGKLDYNYKDKYFISGTIRRDGSSRLGPNNRWGTFPAVSVGWRISDESFMQWANFLSDLKLRGSWGQTGNQQIAPGRTVDQFGGGTGDTFYDITGSNSSITQGFTRTDVGNPDLKWETDTSTDFGFDAGFMDGRLQVTFDWYKKVISDLLFAPVVPGTQGAANPPIKNVGKMSNTGYEFQVSYNGTIGDNLNWNVSLNGSHYTNKIERIASGENSFFGPVQGRGGVLNINKLGYSIGDFYGYQTDGFYDSQQEIDNSPQFAGAAVGRFKFKDINGDGKITAADKTIIGSYHPDFTSGLNLGLQWKNWDFSTFIFGSFGNDIFNLTNEFTVFRLFDTNVRKDLLTDSWTPNHKNAKYPMMNENDDVSSNYSSFYVKNGSYVRLKNIQIGYTLPNSFLALLPGLSSVRVYVQGENLFTITKYPGLDPALPANQTNSAVGNTADQGRGIDRGTYPHNRIVSVGVNIKF